MRKILIIDHDAASQKSTSEVLQMANYKVLAANNGKSALEVAARQQPDVILSSTSLPEMNGYELLYFIRQNPLTACIPFIFLTSKDEISDMRKGMNLGADDYLFKPFDKMELLSCIDARLSKSERCSDKGSYNIEGLNEFLKSNGNVEKLKKLLTGRNIRKVQKKQVIYTEGEVAYNILYVMKGTVKSFFNTEGGKEFITGLSHGGDFVGIVDMLSSEVYRETVVAAENSEVIFIPKNDFFRLFMSSHDVAVRIISLLSKSTLELRERLFHIAYNSVRKRTANALLSFVKADTKITGSPTVTITRDDLASLIGITPESVSRTLHDFKDEKLIAFKNKSSEIVILNTNELQAMKN